MSLLLLCHYLAWGDETLIEYHGDHYVINVEAMNPDSEMTLMDVLLMCPELSFDNGMVLGENHVLCVDGLDLYVDNEVFLQSVKAIEVESIDFYVNPSVSQGVGGTEGFIDITFKKADKDGTTGKLALEGSTYGNGRLYADVLAQQGNLSLKGYALTDLYYAKCGLGEAGNLIMRKMTENAHVSADWDISPKDNLKLKLFQQFADGKAHFRFLQGSYATPDIDRLGSLIFVYTRTLNDREASLQLEGGSTFTNGLEADQSVRQALPYFCAELNTPLLGDDLWLKAGWEIGYENIWKLELNRQQFLKNDFYVQLDYNHGPWVATLGCRQTLLNYWDRYLDDESSRELWSHHRNERSILASAGYRWGRHFVQGSFCRDFYIPSMDDFYEDIMGRSSYNSSYATNLLSRAELRYTYQQRNITLFGSLMHSWTIDLPTPRENLSGIRTSVTWHQGPLRLTAGASFYHQHVAAGEDTPADTNDFYSLKLAPTLLLGHGLRLSANLLYNSSQNPSNARPHLYASVKVNKDLGSHCNVYADFHDLAGPPTIPVSEMTDNYNNRALTLGLTYRF